MKIYKTISVLFLFAFAISIFGCGGGADKEKLVKYYKSSIEFYKSDDFKNNIGDEALMTKKNNEILKSSGFENDKEFEEVSKKYEGDAEIVALATELKAEMDKTIMELEKVKEELNKAGEELEKVGDELDKNLEEDTEGDEETGEVEDTDDTK